MKPNETVTIVNADGSEHIIYDVEDFPISVHAGTLTPTKQCIILPHWHDAIEILYLCEGTTEYMINGTSISLREGQAVFINSRQIHYAYQESPAFCKFIRILLHPSLLSTHSLIEHNFIWPLQNSLEYLILSDNSSWQKEIIQYILDIYSKKGTPAYELSILGNFSLIWGILFQHTPIKPTISNRNNDNLELLRTMLQYIHQNYQQKLSLSMISKAVSICKTKCCSIFSEYLNTTPITYLISYRLKISIDLMKNDTLSLTDIAFLSGFLSSSYYSETFQKVYGDSPSNYRKNLRL